MKAWITIDGILTIFPEGDTEKYSLQNWEQNNTFGILATDIELKNISKEKVPLFTERTMQDARVMLEWFAKQKGTL